MPSISDQLAFEFIRPFTEGSDSRHLRPLGTTLAYDLFWLFAAERQNIFLRRLKGERPPWTDDVILKTFKFTNTYRILDRTSQYLIQHVIYRDGPSNSPSDVFFRIVLFKLFNKVDTWKYLEEAVGGISWKAYDFHLFDEILTRLISQGVAIYSSAYIMPPGTQQWGHAKKHRNHLALLECMMRDRVPEQLMSTRRMQDGFEVLRAYPTIGDFLGYQLITDINYSEIVNYSESEFVVPGPGALSGLHKCFSKFAGLNGPELIRLVADRQDAEFERLSVSFPSLWGRRMQLIDCQNVFCEIDKYTRMSNPEIRGLFNRTRIKRRFSANPEPLSVWFPPKWNLNALIGTEPIRLGWRRTETELQ